MLNALRRNVGATAGSAWRAAAIAGLRLGDASDERDVSSPVGWCAERVAGDRRRPERDVVELGHELRSA